MFWASPILWETMRNTSDWIFTLFSKYARSINLSLYLSISRAYYMQALVLTPGIQQEIRPFKEPTPCDLYLVRACKVMIYNEINAHNKISSKDKAVKKINQDKQIEDDRKTCVEYSIRHIAISWHTLVWFMDVRHLPSYTIIMMLAMLLSIFMAIALKKQENNKTLPMAPNRELSWSSPAFWLQALVHGLSLFADFFSFTACSTPWTKMSHLCHTAMCHVCPQTVPLIHHEWQLPWCHINISYGLFSQCLHGASFTSRLTVEQLLPVPPSILSQCAAEQSSTHSFVFCRIAAFQGSWERLVWRCVGVYLYGDYHPCGVATGWSNSMSKLNGDKFTTSLHLLWREKQRKVRHKQVLEMTSI